MTETTQSLILDLVEWVARQPRPYTDVMDCWRTSCPRLTIWEDAQEDDLVEKFQHRSGAVFVRATDRGRKLLESCGRS